MVRSACTAGWLMLGSLALNSCGPEATPVSPSSPAASAAPLDSAAGVSAITSAALPPAMPSVAADESLDLRHFPHQFSSLVPLDVDTARVGYLDTLIPPGPATEKGTQALRAAQREFDIFSWQSFLALNWPISAQGEPEPTFASATAQRAWSTWRSGESIFLADGGVPTPWTGLPNEVSLFRAKGAWRAHASASENFQAFTGPLVDQNGKWVRYEVLVNSEEFAYLVQNKLYNLEGQAEFSQKFAGNEVSFPVDDMKQHGATEIKLSWKVLGPKDDRSRFFVAHVKILPAEFLPAGQTQPAAPESVDAGLVGMHIAVHTRSSPEWIWATFEQVDNTRVNQSADGKPVHPNFFDPKKPSGPKDVNMLAPKNAILDPATGAPARPGGKPPTTWAESETKTPTQVKRIDVPTQGSLNPFDALLVADAAALNKEAQAKLHEMGSVFQYYELVGTQWPVHPNAPAFAGGANSAPESITHKVPGDVVPVFLVNTSMETFFMRGLQTAGGLEQDDRLASTAPTIDDTMVTGTESCVGCHYSSGICLGFKKNPDGTDLLDPFTHQKQPIFGENSHFGKTGNANFSWLLQIEARSMTAPLPRSAARFLDIGAALHSHGASKAKL